MALMVAFMGIAVFSSCGGDDDDNPSPNSNNKSWFITLSQKQLDGIVNDLSTYDPLSKRQELVDNAPYYYHMTDPELFKWDYLTLGKGIVYPDNNYLRGFFKNIFQHSHVNLWHIVDKNTVEVYPCFLYYGDSKHIARKMIYVGSWNYWGDIYYALTSDDEPWILTYVQADNKMVVSDGTILHLYDDYVVMDGFSNRMMWFTPVGM